MKKIILLTYLLSVVSFNLSSYAFDLQYSTHTSTKDIEFKKAKVLQWYSSNVDNNKFYWYDAEKHVNWLKTRALKWHDDQLINNKFYFIHTDAELAFTKNKALRWYERNSQ